jgi:N-acetylmuramoyl-L-alanine amidase
MSPPAILDRPLSYTGALERRPLQQVDGVVVHCTELPDLTTARAFGEERLYPLSGTGNSGHYYLDRDGRIEQWVSPDRVAHHCRGFNECSIGIELVNLGRYPRWLHSDQQLFDEPYPQVQIDRLIALLAWLATTLPSVRWIAGHEDLDQEVVPASNQPEVRVRRKLDPGPLFPWRQVLAATRLQRRDGLAKP